MAGGTGDKIKGRLKEAVGSLLGDDEMKRDGRAEQASGDAKEKAGEVIDKAKDFVTGKSKKDSDKDKE